MLRNRQDAEDMAQEVFIKLIKAEGRGMELSTIKSDEGLLWTIATNVCLGFIDEKKRKHENIFPLFDEEIPAPVNAFERLDAKMLIQAILDDESEETKMYVYMYFFDGMTLREIAETVGKSKSNVHGKLDTFIKVTRQKLEGTMK
jgi:RNA polymerase sigma factor (sigma-70 family)